MQVRKNKVGVIFESVENTVTVVCIDIDVRNSLQSMFLSEVFDRYTAIVEYAKSSRVLSARMVQTGDRRERARGRAAHHRVDSGKRGANNIGGGIEDSRIRRRIAAVQETRAPLPTSWI